MGQQQLLLLVLGAIIVGVAIIVGINMFATSATNANRDAVIQDCMTLAARAQQWWRTPAILAGGGRDFTTLTTRKIAFPDSNENGKYAIEDGAPGSFTIRGTGFEPDNNPGEVTITVYPDSIGTPVPTSGSGWDTE